MEVGFTSSNWTWGNDGRNTRCMGASFYYRGGLAAAHFRTHGLGGWTAERGRTRKDGAMEILSAEDHEWHAPDVIWTELIGATDEDVEVTLKARATGQVVVGDMDDDVWSVPRTNEAAKIWRRQTDREMYERTQGYFRQLKACDAIICSTEDLCLKAGRRLDRPIYLIRNAIDPSFITPHDPTGLRPSWIGSTPWRANDLGILRTFGISEWLDAHAERLYHGGDLTPPVVTDLERKVLGDEVRYHRPPTLAEQAGINPVNVETRPNVPFQEYPRLWDDVGFALIPLEDCPFNRAKSWLKGLEACAAGVPFIVSAGFPEYLALIAEGAYGLLASNAKPQEWRDAMDVCMDPGVRATMGKVNRKVALTQDIAVRWLEWKAVLEDVAGRRLVESALA